MDRAQAFDSVGPKALGLGVQPKSIVESARWKPNAISRTIYCFVQDGGTFQLEDLAVKASNAVVDTSNVASTSDDAEEDPNGSMAVDGSLDARSEDVTDEEALYKASEDECDTSNGQHDGTVWATEF